MSLCYQNVNVVRKLNTVCDKSHNLDWHRNFLVLKPAVSDLCSDWLHYTEEICGEIVCYLSKREY